MSTDQDAAAIVSDDEEPRYTLEEAQRILAKRDCTFGHRDLDEVANFQHGVVQIVCTHCGARYVRAAQQGGTA